MRLTHLKPFGIKAPALCKHSFIKPLMDAAARNAASGLHLFTPEWNDLPFGRRTT